MCCNSIDLLISWMKVYENLPLIRVVNSFGEKNYEGITTAQRQMRQFCGGKEGGGRELLNQ